LRSGGASVFGGREIFLVKRIFWVLEAREVEASRQEREREFFFWSSGREGESFDEH
jgi:hypothetical protein